MYFIYPASVSENCDKRIIPAVAKCIERFFALQLQDAMASGVLPLKRKWNGKNYGALLMECYNNYNKKQVLCESKYSKVLHEAKLDWDQTTSSDVENWLTTAPNGSEFEESLARLIYSNTGLSQASDSEKLDRMDSLELMKKYLYDESYRYLKNFKAADGQRAKKLRELFSEIDKEKDRIASYKPPDKSDDEFKEWTKKCKQQEWEWKKKHEAEHDEDRRREAIEREEERLNVKFSPGSYTPMQTIVDIAPTSVVVNVPVLYVAGPLHGRFQDDVAVNINVKVIPTQIKNFKMLEKSMLDDYFSKKSESIFKTVGRNVARKAFNSLKKFLPFGVGDAIYDKATAGDESKGDVIYQTQGFVNASAFHKSSNSPNNYNYTSNIVIFNKDDLTDPEDQNIFLNRNAMVKMFKMGWSTFAMLDPVNEMMYFISSLDGGYMHYIPYRYMMETLKSKAYYGDDKKLKDSAKPFMINRGRFSDFGKLFND